MDTLDCYWWLSFRDPDKNEHMGICVIQACDHDEAVAKSHLHQCNPGGEVLIIKITPEDFNNHLKDHIKVNRHYTESELKQTGLPYKFYGS